MCPAIGKHPRLRDWPQQATTDPAQLTHWWRQWPEANIGLVTGGGSGIAIVDIDPRHGGHSSLEELQHTYHPLPETPIALSGGGGPHYYFALSTDLPCPKLAPGIDLLLDGRHYAVAPPSLHQSGRRYTWELSSHPDDVPLAPVPDWLLALVRDATRGDPHGAVTLPDVLPAVDLDALRLSPRLRRVIATGNDVQHPYPSRSEAVFAVLTALIAGGHDDATMAAVVLDPRYGISDKPLGQRNPRSPLYWQLTRGWVAREIARARAKAISRALAPLPVRRPIPALWYAPETVYAPTIRTIDGQEVPPWRR